MKKITAILLLFAMSSTALFSFAACGTDSTESSNIVDSQTESGSSREENKRASQIRALMSGQKPDRTMKAANILKDIPYTYINEPTESYNDPDRKKLSDGIVRDLFDKYNWVGFRGGKSPTVDYDLGTRDHGLSVVTVDCLRQVSYGIELPKEVSLSASDDGENYTVISTLCAPSDIPESGKYTYRFSLPETLSARYIRITMPYKAGGFVFVDEIAGYAYREDGDTDLSIGETNSAEEEEYDFYHYALQTGTSVPVSGTDRDYNLRQNLARLNGVQVQADHFDPMSQDVCRNNTPADQLGMLIDGEKAKYAVYGDLAFYRFTRGYGRHVVVDLGNEMAVEEVTLQFLNQVTVGVGVPPSVMIELSTDGENWTVVYAKSTGVYGDREAALIDVRAVFAKAYRCRYVRSTFLTVPHNTTSSSVYLSEIEVFGKKNTANASEAVIDPSLTMGHYPDPEAFGCENILFVPIAGGNKDTAETVKPLMQYVDANGEEKGRFFDSICISAASSFERSGDAKKTIESLYSEAFAENINLSAWNQVGAQQTDGKKTTVWFALLCPKSGDTCGDLNGDGKEENLSSEEGLFAYLKYQVDEILANMQSYEKLDFLGFYWEEEYLSSEATGLTARCIRRINAYIHSLGYKSFWCPYYNAYGFWMWEDLGFDFAVLQPNYMFYATESTRLSTAAETARMLGMSVELEIEDYVSEGSVALYREYLREGYDSGYMHSIKLYYHGGTPGAFYLSSKNHREVYEDTRKFSMCELDESYNRKQAVSLDGFSDQTLTVKDGESIISELDDLSSCTVTVLQSPVFGKLQIDRSGQLRYTAMQNYRGEEIVILGISDPAGNNKEITITIQVTE